MSRNANEIGELLRHRLLPALPVPFTSDRLIHHDSHVRMGQYLSTTPISGVAVWAHTGRGLYLTEAERAIVLTHWRKSLPNGVIVAGAGGGGANILGDQPDSDDLYFEHTRMMAAQAKSLGADAILCYAPTRFRDRNKREKRDAILHYHREIASVGLPLILFYLYEDAGGISYSRDVLNDLFQIPDVIGIKMATLNSVMTFQDTAALIKSEHPNQLVITGEDRFLGYSLMMGADAALIGMGGALTGFQSEMMASYYRRDLEDFHYRSQFVDRFAQATFISPMEGYIARMLYVMSCLGIISSSAIFDPWGPSLPQSDFDAIDNFLASLPIELKQ